LTGIKPATPETGARDRYAGDLPDSTSRAMLDKDLFSGLVRLHVLHHAAEGPVFGLAIIEELRHHGYDISAGTMYPLLHGLERKGYLTSSQERSGQRQRRVYIITPAGQLALKEGRSKVRELFGEIVGGHDARERKGR
jgi:DNA-binding PadR family transcriptional regulator